MTVPIRTCHGREEARPQLDPREPGAHDADGAAANAA